MKNYIPRMVLVSLLAFSVLLPSAAVAKNDTQERQNERKEAHRERKEAKQAGNPAQKEAKRAEESDNGNCLKAVGHLIAKGWKKKNEVSVSPDCHLPFGIGKKQNGQNGTTTPDTSAPVIQFITVKQHGTSATLRFVTGEKTSTRVFWSTVSPVVIGEASTGNVMSEKLVRFHDLKLSGLSASTTYYALIEARDAFGNTGTSTEFFFTTKAETADSKPPVISNVVATAATSSVLVSWKTNEPAHSSVFYGTTSSMSVSATSTSVVVGATLTEKHQVRIIGLQADTRYYVVVSSTDVKGNTRTTSEFSVKTASGS
ncbi:MAG: fibronectin type III domain-containing protein [bacterium]|nr:fibronectin type III domain-containing protein [bacterium]